MNVSVIKEGEDIFLPIIDRLIKEAVDFSKNLVVFPGKRPSYFLFNEIRNSIKTSFIPPSVFSIDEFVDYCYEKELGIYDKKIDPLSGCKIIREILKEENFYSRQLESTSLFIPLGIKIYSTLEELLIEGVTKARLRQEDYLADISKEYTGKDSITGYLEKIIRLSDIYNRFYEILERQNLSTRSMRYKRVSDAELKLTGYERIIFAGFFALTDCERRIFEKLGSDERALFLFQGESAKKYAFERVYEPIKVDIEKIDIYECPDTHSEVFKVSSLLEEELKDKRGKESFLIVSPSSDSVIPLINSLNLTLNEDYNVSLGYPLDRTPLFSFIKHLFDIFKTMKDDKVYIPDYLKFVLHPYTKNILLKNETELTRIVFHTLEERLAEESFINYRDLKELEDNEFLDKIHKQIKELISIQELKEFIKEIHKSTIYRFVNLNNLRDFTQKLKGLINFIYEKSTAKLHILFFPYCEAMLSALTDLESSLFSEEKLKSPVEYFDLFKKFISLYNVPFHGTPIKDIQVLGFLESRNLKFDNVYILDVNEGIIPSSEREDELLPFDVRKRLNVPTYVEKDILYEYYLNNIIAGAKKVSLFYVENENKERSRFIEKIIWEKQKNKGKIENFVTTISYNIKLTPYKPREIEKNDEVIGYLKNMTYSASSIDTYYNCQLMFYYQYVLMPQQTEGILESLEGKDVGNIIHDILREYYIVKSIDLDEKRLQEVIEKILINKFGTNLTGKLLILKYQIERQLKNFIGKYKENVKAKEVEIIELEKDFNPFEVYIENLGKIKIKGRIDRIEKRDGQIFVVDFKKSSNESRYKVRWDKFDLNKREEWQRSFKSIQLFFYIFLLDKSNNVVYKPDNGSYFLLEKKDLSQSEIMLFKDLNDKEDNFSNIDKIITKLIEEIILSPIFKPTENLETCKNCPYKDVCWQEDGKKLNL